MSIIRTVSSPTGMRRDDSDGKGPRRAPRATLREHWHRPLAHSAPHFQGQSRGSVRASASLSGGALRVMVVIWAMWAQWALPVVAAAACSCLQAPLAPGLCGQPAPDPPGPAALEGAGSLLAPSCPRAVSFWKAVSLVTLCREGPGPFWPEGRHRAREAPGPWY
jgi:hypothetical protein